MMMISIMVMIMINDDDKNLPPLPELPDELQSALAEGSWVRNEESDVSWLRFCIFYFRILVFSFLFSFEI